MTSRRPDPYYRRARAAGLRARSACKLRELDARFGLLRPGDAVVDLGAAPGGWLQIAAERVGAAGRVVGLDVSSIAPLGTDHVVVIAGDVRDATTRHAVRAALGRPADVVLSDLAPKLSGVRTTDEARCAELVAATLMALPEILRPGGRLLMKLFMDSVYHDTLARLRAAFSDVRTTRPEATRRGSSELYATALGFRGKSR